jgi:hypothetical protein
MALTLENINLVRQKCRLDSFKFVGPARILKALFEQFNEVLGNRDLQFVPFQLVNAGDTVIADAACKLYFLVAIKPAGSTTDAWVKGSNSATAAAGAGDVVLPMKGTGGGGKAQTLVFPDGLPLSSGLTIASHTTVNGTTRSADADSSYGFAIVGGP